MTGDREAERRWSEGMVMGGAMGTVWRPGFAEGVATAVEGEGEDEGVEGTARAVGAGVVGAGVGRVSTATATAAGRSAGAGIEAGVGVEAAGVDAAGRRAAEKTDGEGVAVAAAWVAHLEGEDFCLLTASPSQSSPS
jgi:hypothetical protein